MAHVLLAGVGNIGSHLLSHLARLAAVLRLTVVDRGRYDAAANLIGQDVTVRDLGRWKASVQVRRVRRINPTLPVQAVHASLDDLPIGLLRADLILACLDSRRARMVVNQTAWRLGIPWIDAGVHGDGLLARVQVFVPGPEAPCLECGWTASDYAAVEQDYPCGSSDAWWPTHASSSLGALAAALQAVECEKILAADTATALVGRELIIDARYHRHFVSAVSKNPHCRMPDHDGWCIERLAEPPSRTTLRALVARAGFRVDDDLTVAVANRHWGLALRCRACGTVKATARLERGDRRGRAVCACGAPLLVHGCDLHDAAPVGALSPRLLDVPISRLGLRARDVVSLSANGRIVRYELGGAA
jgi:molybdopterin/thiamine biosynthesis adenylyltransferase